MATLPKKFHDTSHPRVVSLLCSATETISFLGCEEQLVGISHECDYPGSVLDRPRCTSTKFDIDGTSYQIDERIKALLQEGLSVYRVDAGALESLKPDIIVTQTQCEVCAVSLKDVEAAACELISSRPHIVALDPNRLDDIFTDMLKVADAIGIAGRGEFIVGELRAQMDAVAAKARALPHKPRVACIEWIAPLMTAGNWMPELIEMAGGTPMLGEAGKHSPFISFENLAAAEPDIVVMMPCGWDRHRARAESASLRQHPGWDSLPAVRSGRVYAADGNQYFNRPGPRIVESLRILSEMIHPGHFDFGMRDSAWEVL